ncbi:response regulator [Phormidesmis sp. 146-33]
MIRLVLVDDQVIIRQGLKSLLELELDLEIVGDAEDGQQAIDLIASLHSTLQQPDVVLMDVRMPIMDGVAATQHLRDHFPETRVLILTTFDDAEYVSQAMRFGASGYLMKDTPAEELAVAIRSVFQGYTHLGPGLFEKTLSAPTSGRSNEDTDLSPREYDVLRLIASGASNREIAQKLYISERTVRNHVTHILNRLNLRDRTQAALWAHGNLEQRSF